MMTQLGVWIVTMGYFGFTLALPPLQVRENEEFCIKNDELLYLT